MSKRWLRHLWLTITIRQHLILPFIFSLISALISLVGTIAALMMLKSAPYWLIIILSSLFLLSTAYITIYFIHGPKLHYSDFWPNTKGARKWLKPKMTGNPSHLHRCGVGTVTVLGVACTDIGYLFEEIVEAISAGVTFRVVMVNPESPDVGPGGVIKKWEHDREVEVVVQRPLANELDKLASRYEKNGRADRGREFRRLKIQLEHKDYTDHSECIKVCGKAWSLAAKEAKARIPKTMGSVSIYYLDDLPFARQWVLGDKAFLYSLYVGHPGIGTDNPVFCYSVLEGNAEGSGEMCQRAAYYADQLIAKLDNSHKKTLVL